MLEPLWSELRWNLVFLWILQRVDLVEIGEHVALDNCCGESLMGLLRLSHLFFKVPITHVSVVCFEQVALLWRVLRADCIHTVEGKDLLTNLSNVYLLKYAS